MSKIKIIEPPITDQRRIRLGRTSTNPNWGGGTSESFKTFVTGSAILVSRENPGPPYRSGGPFCVIHAEDTCSATAERDWVQGGTIHYNGCFVPKFLNGSTGGWINNITSVKSFVNANTAQAAFASFAHYGPTAVRRYRPDMPSMGLAQFVAELRDLPRLPFKVLELRNTAAFMRQLGSEYLNLEFGWLPFLKDVRDLLNYRSVMDKRLRQLIKDNRKVVRRRGPVAEESTNETVKATFSQSNAGSYLNGTVVTQGNPRGMLVTDISYRKKVWFAGAFQYYIENLDQPEGIDELERKVAGLSITPSLLWELMPWSWLIDWFTTIGDSLANIYASVADRSVMRYGYLMCEETWTATSTFQGECDQRKPTGAFDHWGYWVVTPTTVKSLSAQRTVKQIRRSRIAASPYGFGISQWQSLSDRQRAILVALGLSSKYNK